MNKKKNEIKRMKTDSKFLETLFMQCVDWEDFNRRMREMFEAKQEKAVVMASNEFITIIFKAWEAGYIIIPGNNAIVDLSKYLYDNFLFVNQKKPDSYLSLTSIRRVLYK